jgi:hypothetical protein
VLIKLSIVVVALIFIYQKLTNNSKLSCYDFIHFLTKNHVFSSKHTISLLILTFFNWLFEILKWQKLVSPIKKISFGNATEQSLGSLTASLFTPNRIGEYGAKAAFYIKVHRKRVMLVNLLSNIMQMTVTTVLGLIGLSFFLDTYPLKMDYNKALALITIVVFIGLMAYYFLGKYTFTVRGIQLKKILTFINHIPKKTVLIGLGFSVARYLIFSFQFYYLLLIFKIEVDYFNAMAIISSMYLLASILPSIFIFDVVLKGSVAVYLFSFLNIGEFTILTIVTFMWVFNFVLPSIIGSYYVLRFKFPEIHVQV